MSDSPGRSSYSADDRAGGDDEGWGSPVPAEYGSLRAVRPVATSPVSAPDEPVHPDRAAGPAALDRAAGGARLDGAPADRGGLPPLLERLTVNSVTERLRRRLGTDDSAQVPPEGINGFGPAASQEVASEPVGSRDIGSQPVAGAAPAVDSGPSTDAGAPADGAWGAFSDTTAVPVVPPVPPVPADEGIDPDALGPALVGPDMLLGSRRRRRGRRPTRVRTRATIRHLDIMTVIRVSVVFWAVVLIALVVASVLLWVFADAFGSLPSIEKSVRTLFSLKSFTLHPGAIAMYTAAGGVVVAVAGTLANVVLALIYNLIADVVGGIRVELESFSAE